MQISATQYWILIAIALILSACITWLWRTVRRRRLAGETAVTPPSWIEMWWQSGRAVWQQEVRNNDSATIQVIIALAAILISLSIGYGYGTISLVTGWQLWTWGISCLILVIALMPHRRLPLPQAIPWRWLAGLLIVAFLLRFPLLDTIPGGLHIDEKGVAGYSMRHVFPAGSFTINPFHTASNSQPALFNYLVRLSFALFGYNFTALRGISAVVGSLAVLATYFAVAELDNRRTGLITAVIMTTYHYHIQWSRLGLNNIWDTLWVPLVLAFFTFGYRRGWSGGAVLAGVALGLSQYFYAGSKTVLFVLPFLLWKLWKEEGDSHRMVIHAGKMGATAVAIGAPITLFALLKPDLFFQRSRVVWGWSVPTITATLGEVDYGRYLWHQIYRNVGSFTTIPEVTGFYGPGVPYLIGVAAPLFVIGVLWFVWKRQWIPLLWLFFALLFGGFLLSGAPSSSHHVVMIPVICWATAVPLNALWQSGRWRLAIALILLIVATDLFFYFGIYVPRGPRDLFHELPEPPY